MGEKEGSFLVIRIGDKGAIASHLITVKGELKDRWYENGLKDFIEKKVKEIDDILQAEIEMLRIENKKIEVGVLIAGIGTSGALKEWSREWLDNHISENIAEIMSIEIKPISSLARLCDLE